MIDSECNAASDDDGECCAEITISTRRFCKENGYAATDAFMLAIEREDGCVVPVPVGSVERVVELVREINPRLVHVAALDDEHAPLMAEIRALVAGDMAAKLFGPPMDAPGAVLH
jgi:hypothetical protein